MQICLSYCLGKALYCSFQDTLSPNYSSRHIILIRIAASGSTIKTHNFLEGNLSNKKAKQTSTVAYLVVT